MPAPWRLFVDTGGTFTDALAVGPDGEGRRAKVLSSSALRGTVEGAAGPERLRVRFGVPLPRDFVRGFRFRPLGSAGPGVPVEGYDPGEGWLDLAAGGPPPPAAGTPFEVRSPEEAPLLAARLLTGTPAGAPLPPVAMRLATTRGTNALLERAGARTALFVTAGFGDLLEIGTQQRPDLFALAVAKPPPLHAAVVEVEERVAADGTVLRAWNPGRVRAAARRLRAEGIEAAAVTLLHSWRNPAHERAVRDLLREEGFATVVASSDLAPLVRILPRAETAVVDAYLGPAVRGYLDRVGAGLGGGTLHAMTSAGGLVAAAAFRPRDGLLSGPAGGVVGAARAGRRAGFSRVIGFDMGGTSTDVARFDGDFDYRFEHTVGDARVLAPALAIETVAAGGGSICAVEDGRLRVGPGSAGADPGPACYGAGGPLTLTDVDLLLGRLAPDRFEIPLDPGAAERAMERIRDALGGAVSREALLRGFLDIADERVAGAVRSVSLRRGFDPAGHALVAFGGAGGQHACAVAERLGIDTVVVPPGAGLLSALGLEAALVERFAEEQVLGPLDEVEGELEGRLEALGRRAAAAVAAEGIPADRIEVRRRILHMRFRGQDAVLPVEPAPGVPAGDAFRERYREVFGERPEGRAVEVESLRVVASARGREEEAPPAAPGPFDAEPPREGGALPRYDREGLAPGARVRGPALVPERYGTTVVGRGWAATVDGGGALVLRREGGGEDGGASGGAGGAAGGGRPRPEAVERELFTHRFHAVALEMGDMLRRTAVSTNVKERLDFSCALLDPGGRLVVNAPHIPVHLGSLGLCVRSVRDALPLGPGDVAVTNHPAFGGSHLPDVTVLMPVHDREGTLLGWTAARAHHAELGGIRPGSMPPDARCLEEEGVVIPPMHLVRGGRGCGEEVRRALRGARWPTRAVEDNLADLRAAVAACRRGAEALRALAGAHGRETVARHMEGLQALAERLVGDALERREGTAGAAVERLDDGTEIRVRAEVSGRRASLSFAGSGPVHPGSLNATPAVVLSAVLYVLRLLVDTPLPLNEGLMRAVAVDLPEGFLNPPFPDDPRRAPAVVGGNVETSQRVVDALVRAFRLAAGSQGTMNNVAFGTAGFGYYETVCGGCGAGPGFHGASAVHSHMTNTRITDPEVLEHRYPVRLERFAVRRGSGGAGRWRGGDGAVREIRFLAPMSLSLLAQRRVEGPRGMEGGGDGLPGRQRLLRADGREEDLPSVAGVEVSPGDRLLLETPGGGAWGA